jgi:hypothetical protein
VALKTRATKQEKAAEIYYASENFFQSPEKNAEG